MSERRHLLETMRRPLHPRLRIRRSTALLLIVAVALSLLYLGIRQTAAERASSNGPVAVQCDKTLKHCAFIRAPTTTVPRTPTTKPTTSTTKPPTSTTATTTSTTRPGQATTSTTRAPSGTTTPGTTSTSTTATTTTTVPPSSGSSTSTSSTSSTTAPSSTTP